MPVPSLLIPILFQAMAAVAVQVRVGIHTHSLWSAVRAALPRAGSARPHSLARLPTALRDAIVMRQLAVENACIQGFECTAPAAGPGSKPSDMRTDLLLAACRVLAATVARHRPCIATMPAWSRAGTLCSCMRICLPSGRWNCGSVWNCVGILCEGLPARGED